MPNDAACPARLLWSLLAGAVRLLREQGFEPTIIWTNPNIQPVSEHLRRLDTLRSWAADVAHVDVIVCR